MQSKARMARARTDPEGRTLLKLVGKGPYLLAAVGMIRRAGENGPEAADWESYWCSLTFDLANAKSLPTTKKKALNHEERNDCSEGLCEKSMRYL
jgi:hypothetical protein